MREKPVKHSIRCFCSSFRRFFLTITGDTWKAPLRRNSMRLKPPKAAATWSWLPTLSPITFCSMWMASRASCSLLTMLPFSAASACTRPTVKEELEPRPERAGRSPSWWISRPLLQLAQPSTPRTAGCLISSQWRTFSIAE